MRRLIAVLVGLALQTCPVTGASAQRAAAPPAGQMTWAVRFTLAPRWLDPAESEGSITPFLTLYAVHDALLKPMPSGRSAVGLAQRPRLRLHAVEQRALPRERVTAEDVKEMLHQIQRMLNDRKIFAPIWENGFIRGIGPRVEEPALSLIPFFPHSAPCEDVRLKP